MRLDAFELVQCFRGDVTLTAARAADDWDVFDHKQTGTLPVASSDIADSGSTPAAQIAGERRGLPTILHIP